jgi:hypothetical protein
MFFKNQIIIDMYGNPIDALYNALGAAQGALAFVRSNPLILRSPETAVISGFMPEPH